jgi:Fe-S-cluster containining protein
MEKNNWIFLTRDEALDAIAIDFQQYGPQPLIFRELAPLILNSRCRITPGKKDSGIWIQHGQDYPLQKIDDKDLGFYFSHILETTAFSLKMIASICAIVFQTRACPGVSQEKDLHGIWIENHMNDFVCHRCGHCCTNLGYDNDCTKEDYLKWQTFGRQDILDRVMIVHKSRNDIQYRIWLDQDTGAIAKICPWLKPNPKEQGFFCLIQDIKPEICQQYPFTRKHAVMTGCKGEFPTFFKDKRPVHFEGQDRRGIKYNESTKQP